MSTQTPKGLLATKQPDLWFEDNAVGRLKKEIWEASDARIDAWLAEYGMPSPCEWAKPGAYIQTRLRLATLGNGSFAASRCFLPVFAGSKMFEFNEITDQPHRNTRLPRSPFTRPS